MELPWDARLPFASPRVNEFETIRAVRQVLKDRVTHREGPWVGRERREGLFAQTTGAVSIGRILERRLLNPTEYLLEVGCGGRFVCH